MTLRIYNTLSRTKEPLEPLLPGKIGIYLCGPTVYKPSHIGHMVGPVIFDSFKRYLTYNGYQVTWVVNITDVDDKLIAEARRRGISMAAVAREMTDDYLENLRRLGVDGVDHFPQATDNIGEIIRFVQRLIEQGFAYAVGGDVYFEVSRHAEYGKLSGRTVESMLGAGRQAAEQKRSAADFALWKGAKPGEPSWDSPWGPGRPGWHIECSAMSRSILGETFDIHGGGLDLVFPHHENEISQSECCHGKPMARFWMHNGLMQASHEVGKLGGRATRTAPAETAPAAKMSKSTGAQPFRELLEKHAPETIRFFLLATHYRRPIDFSEQRIAEVHAGLDTFYRFFQRYGRITGSSAYDLAPPRLRTEGDRNGGGDALLDQVGQRRRAFLEAMDDDFNTGGAIGELFDLVRLLNRFCDEQNLDQPDKASPQAQAKLTQATVVLRELADTLGLFRVPPAATAPADDALVAQLIDLLVEIRGTARKNKDFALADRVRDRLGELGITIEDRPGGTQWSLR